MIIMHRTLSQGDENEDEEKAVIGFWSAFSWLVGMTLIISLLSEYVVATIEVHTDKYSFFFLTTLFLKCINSEFSMA